MKKFRNCFLSSLVTAIIALSLCTSHAYGVSQGHSENEDCDEAAVFSQVESISYLKNIQSINSLRVPEDEVKKDKQLLDYTQSAFYNEIPSNYNELIKLNSISAKSISYPLSSYPIGNYFNKHVTSPCRLVDGTKSICAKYSTPASKRYHGQNCSYNVSQCDCKIYNNSIQCMGFANQIFKLTNSVDTCSNNQYCSMILESTELARAYIESVGVGSHIRLNVPNKDYDHSIIVAGYDSSNIKIYEANYVGRCEISMRTVKWSNFISEYDKILKSWSVNHVHKLDPSTEYEIVGTKQVCRLRSSNCLGCDTIFTQTINQHMYAQGNICYHCGYSPNS